MSKIVKNKDIAEFDLEKQVSLDAGGDVGYMAGEKAVIRKDVFKASQEAQKIVDEARLEAQKIKEHAKSLLAKVEQESERSKSQGREEGREEGLGEVSELLLKAHDEKDKMFEGLEKSIVNLVYDISEKIIGKELREREGAILDLIRQALRAAMGQHIVIMVSPADYENVRQGQAALMQVLDASRTIQIRHDESVKPGGCVIETEVGTIDARLETQLAAIRKALGIESAEPT